MKLPNENKVCFFCKHGKSYNNDLVWCSNVQSIHAKRIEKYGTSRISRISREVRFPYSSCGSFKEEKGAAMKLVELKLTGKYRRHDHEKGRSGHLTSG